MVGFSLINRCRNQAKKVIPPIASILIIFILWQVYIWIFNIPVYLLPTPLKILESFIHNAWLIFYNAKTSIFEATIGFLFSIPVAVLLAILVVWSRTIDRTVMPFVIFSQTVPKVAIAPLLLVWFGFGIISKVLIVFMMAFFPIFISMLSGLRAVDHEMLNLINSMRPSKLQVFMKLRIPNSLPFLLDGFRLAVVRSVLAAVVAEWISSDRGLGHLVLYADAASDAPLLFGTIALLAGMGLVGFLIVTALGRFMVPWYFAMRKTEIVKEQRH
jgi:NitT/TauT family transport system permease protein